MVQLVGRKLGPQILSSLRQEGLTGANGRVVGAAEVLAGDAVSLRMSGPRCCSSTAGSHRSAWLQQMLQVCEQRLCRMPVPCVASTCSGLTSSQQASDSMTVCCMRAVCGAARSLTVVAQVKNSASKYSRFRAKVKISASVTLAGSSACGDPCSR